MSIYSYIQQYVFQRTIVVNKSFLLFLTLSCFSGEHIFFFLIFNRFSGLYSKQKTKAMAPRFKFVP